MPYVDISRDDDFASIWYITNSSSGHASSFDLQKPTILLLHPHFLDSTWLSHQFGDPRLSRDYNLVAFDWRACGKTIARYNAKRDAWTDAIDIALVCDALCLSAVHIWASEAVSVDAALRLSILFPESCLSLTMLSVTPLELSELSPEGDELVRMWANADDLETLEFALFQLVSGIIGADVDPDLADDLIAYFETTYPPFRAGRLSQLRTLNVHRRPLSRKDLALVRTPCLLIHGELNQMHPLRCAQATAADLVNARGGAKLIIMPGCTGYFSLVPKWASVANRIFIQFLRSLPHAPTELHAPSEPLDLRLHRALHRLAELTGDEHMVDVEEPLSSMSFSRTPESLQKIYVSQVKEAAKRQRRAWSPLDSEGRPIRRYSERKHDHWFQGDRRGVSYARGAGPKKETSASRNKRADTSQEAYAEPSATGREVIPRNATDRGQVTSAAINRVEQSVIKSNIGRATASIPKILSRS